MQDEVEHPGAGGALEELARYLTLLESGRADQAHVIAEARAIQAKLQGLGARLERLVRRTGSSFGDNLAQSPTVWEKAASRKDTGSKTES